jgi:hypothetical protein
MSAEPDAASERICEDSDDRLTFASEPDDDASAAPVDVLLVALAVLLVALSAATLALPCCVRAASVCVDCTRDGGVEIFTMGVPDRFDLDIGKVEPNFSAR